MKKEKISKKLVCPKCGTFWATLDISGYPNLNGNDVIIIAGKKRKMRDGESLACSSCSYEYTTWDVVLSAANSNDYGDIKPGQTLDPKDRIPHTSTSAHRPKSLEVK